MRDIPSENSEQKALVAWLGREFPDLPYYAVPNGGWRNIITAALLKLLGVKPGVPDLCFCVARKGFHGLYIEMKRVKGGQLSKDQKKWLEKLTRQGYLAVVCKGAEEAKTVLLDYLAEEIACC